MNRIPEKRRPDHPGSGSPSETGDGRTPEGVVILRSQLFSHYPGLLFGVSTRNGGVSPEPFGMNTSFNVGDDPALVQLNRERFLGKLNVPGGRLAMPSQIHGSTIRLVTEPGRYDACDGLITRKRQLFLAISVADCLPIFLFDPVRETVGVVHAGWKGTKLGILSGALELLAGQSTRPEDLVVHIGPGAGVCCYEVGEEVACEFESPYVDRTGGRKPRLDLKAMNRAVLIAAGVPEQHIEISGICTICNPDLLHSYRREGIRSGRMMGIIGIA